MCALRRLIREQLLEQTLAAEGLLHELDAAQLLLVLLELEQPREKEHDLQNST